MFLSAQRATHGANVNDVEELVLWLVRVVASGVSLEGCCVENVLLYNLYTAGLGGLVINYERFISWGRVQPKRTFL